MQTRAIDCWVNVNMGDFAPPDHLVRVKEDYLHGGNDVFRSFTPEEMLEIMDEYGIERAIISHTGDGNPRSLDFVERFPERFALSVGVNPTKMMPEVWRLESLVRNLPVVLARVIPFDCQVAPSDGEFVPRPSAKDVRGRVQKAARRFRAEVHALLPST